MSAEPVCGGSGQDPSISLAVEMFYKNATIATGPAAVRAYFLRTIAGRPRRPDRTRSRFDRTNLEIPARLPQ